jgi:hypothetical protein
MNERTIGAMQPATSYVVRIDRTVQPGTVLQHLRRFVVHCFYDDSPNVDRKRNTFCLLLLALFFSIVVVDNLLSKLQKNQDPDIDETVVEPVGAQHKRQYKNNK